MGNETSQQQDLQQQGADGAAGPVMPGLQGIGAINAGIIAKQPGAVNLAAQRVGNGGNVSVGEGNEGALLTQLVQLLHQRPRNALLLSDLGALLPQNLRTSVKEKGGLRSWLQKHPLLFQVSGQPGKESVTLTIGGPASDNAAAGGPAQNGTIQDTGANSASQKKEQDEDDEETASCVQMRGLPYRATAQDVKTFLGRHATGLKDDTSVQLVLNRDGRPSGFARVQFISPACARAARDELHNAVMRTAAENGGSSQERYVEIFLYSERPNKLRFRKGLAPGEGQTSNPGYDEADGVTKEQVIQECREHMACQGKAQLLLSMLGVALSPTTRQHLKKTDLGLKHFLTQYPLEFKVEGVKGREMITYLPAMPNALIPGPSMLQQPPASGHQHAAQEADAVGTDRRSKRASKGAMGGPATGNLNELTRAAQANLEEQLLRSPGFPGSPGCPRIPAMPGTPSDWGTPLIGDHFTEHPWEHHPRRDQISSQDSKSTKPAASQPEFMGSLDPAAGWAAWGMPPAGAYWPSPQAGGMPPWAPGANPVLPPWMMDPQLAGALSGSAMTSPSPMGGMGHPMTIPSAAPLPVPGKASAKEHAAEQTCALRLRGLPFTCSEQEVFAFFSKHDVVEGIADVNKAVSFLQKNNGRATGQAVVQMKSKQDADVAQQALNGQWIGQRYIEVFPYCEEADAPSDGHLKGEDVSALGGSGQEPEVPSVGDTGGSSSPIPGMMPPGIAPWQMGMYGLGAGRDVSMEAMMKAMGPPPVPGQTPLPGAYGPGSGNSTQADANGASEGGDWAVLFDFLKREGQPGLPSEGNPAHVHVYQTGI